MFVHVYIAWTCTKLYNLVDIWMYKRATTSLPVEEKDNKYGKLAIWLRTTNFYVLISFFTFNRNEILKTNY